MLPVLVVTTSFCFFNCATLTASLSSEPSATLVIRRVIAGVPFVPVVISLPTETVPFVALAATLVKKEAPD